MKIGIDIRAIASQRTGDETYTLELVKNLARIDRKNEYFLYTDTFSEEKLAKIKKLLSLDNANFFIKSVGPTSKLFWTFYSLAKQARKDKLDILHVQYIAPIFLRKDIRIITTIHDISFERYPQFIAKKDLLALKLLIPPSLHRADKIIAVSKFTAQEIKNVYPRVAGKVEMIYNGGVSEDFGVVTKKDVLNFRKKYGKLKPYLLYLGTLQPRKNVPFLLRAFRELKKKHSQRDSLVKNCKLVIRGTRGGRNYDWRIDSILEDIRKDNPNIYNDIKFLGYQSTKELAVLLREAEVFCFPSLYEGFGLPVLETMAVGTPVLASDSSCLPEIVGDGGVLYRGDNQSDFVEKVRRLLLDRDLRSRVAEAGRLRVKDFSWEKTARETLELYNKLR